MNWSAFYDCGTFWDHAHFHALSNFVDYILEGSIITDYLANVRVKAKIRN